MKIGTVRLDAASIADAHRQAGYADPTRTYAVRKAVAGLARTNPQPPGQAKALTAAGLAAIRATACQPRKLGGMANRHEAPENARSRGLMDIAICSIMRDALMRRSEAADLRWSDIEVHEDGTGRLLIRRSKTDQEGKGFVTYLGPATVMDLLEIRPAEADPEDKIIGLTGNAIGRRIRAAALTSDLGDGFSGHSCRVGMAIDLARQGDHPGNHAGGPLEERSDGGQVHPGRGGRHRSGRQVLRATALTCPEALPGAFLGHSGVYLAVSRPGGRINGQA